ncbi:uncharacterized protein LOC125659858 isoform X2 [Ostrea edulis]|uniref:uncharacterized protein LOC125659858 isoform X2 n=1 Tax=Ostrea edulis TaxID=37623 RepID=UPI0024AFC0D7|nr:uncharacterized protein LOC125659858 isoform X2 [Ostrea edulis]
MAGTCVKEYNCLMIYNHARSRLATSDDTDLSLRVVKNADDRLTQWGYRKNHYHDRDCIPGRNVFTELFRVVDSSQFVLIFLTKGFLENCWVRYCQMATFKKLIDESTRPECIASHRVIPVLINVSAEQIPQELGQLTCICFVNDWESNDGEWLKLKRALDGPSVQESAQNNDDPVVTLASQHMTQGILESENMNASSMPNRAVRVPVNGSLSSLNSSSLARVAPSSRDTSARLRNPNPSLSDGNGSTLFTGDSLDSSLLFSSRRDSSNPTNQSSSSLGLNSSQPGSNMSRYSGSNSSQPGSNLSHSPSLQRPSQMESTSYEEEVTLSGSRSQLRDPEATRARLSEMNRPITHTSSVIGSDTSMDGVVSVDENETSVKEVIRQFPREPPLHLQSSDLEADAQQSTSPVVASVSPFIAHSQSGFSLSSYTSGVSDSGIEDESQLNGPEAESLSLNSFLEDSTEQECLNSDDVNSHSAVRREEFDTSVIHGSEERESRPSIFAQFLYLSLHAALQPEKTYQPL